MALTIKVPQGHVISDEVWEFFKLDLKQDNEFCKLCKRYYEAEADSKWKKTQEIERQINIRVEQYYAYWLKKYGSAKLSLKEVMEILEGEDKEKFRLRAATAFFLADFMEDCFMEMNATIRKVLPDAQYNPLEDFTKLQKKVSVFTKEILDSEGPEYRDVFDEHASGIKMTIYNKVNGFLNKTEKEKEKEGGQLEIEFGN